MTQEQNYFELFGLVPTFVIDSHLLAERYRALQRETHPDRFAHAGAREQRLAVQQTARLNDALTTLKSPIKRGGYLLALKGVELDHESSRAMDPTFLIEQMELREGLEGVSGTADPEVALAGLQARVDTDWRQLLDEFVARLEQGDEDSLQQAAATLRKLQFLDKMNQEIEHLEDQLTDD